MEGGNTCQCSEGRVYLLSHLLLLDLEFEELLDGLLDAVGYLMQRLVLSNQCMQGLDDLPPHGLIEDIQRSEGLHST